MIPRSWVLVALLGWAWPSWAGGQQPAELAVIDAQLQLGEWEQARVAALEHIDTELGGPSSGCLGATVARLALAETGLKKREDALWHWGTAQNLDAQAGRKANLPLQQHPQAVRFQHNIAKAPVAPAPAGEAP